MNDLLEKTCRNLINISLMYKYSTNQHNGSNLPSVTVPKLKVLFKDITHKMKYYATIEIKKRENVLA